MGPQGLESFGISAEIITTYSKIANEGGAKSGALCPNLAEIISIWPSLAPEMQEEALFFIKSLLPGGI